MLLLSADLLRKLGKLPCFAEVEHDLTPLHDVDVSRGDRIVFISHRWWQPDSPDGASAEKVALVLSLLEAHIQPHKPGGRIYLWWDFASITQKTHALHHACDKGAQILAIPFYLVAVDAMIVLDGGDAEAYAAGGEAAGVEWCKAGFDLRGC